VCKVSEALEDMSQATVKVDDLRRSPVSMNVCTSISRCNFVTRPDISPPT
jgi:hypothetical protein